MYLVSSDIFPRRTQQTMDCIISSWKEGKKLNLYRKSPCGLYPLSKIDSGVNYFVLALEHLGCETLYSCEGHFDKENYIPQLYITFSCQKSTIKFLKQILFGILALEHDYDNEYTLRINFESNKDKTKKLTHLSNQWNKILGPIKYKDKKHERI